MFSFSKHELAARMQATGITGYLLKQRKTLSDQGKQCHQQPSAQLSTRDMNIASLSQSKKKACTVSQHNGMDESASEGNV